MNSKDLKKVTELITNTLSLFDISPDQLEIADSEDTLTVQLNLPEEETGVFIGHQGETLSSLQLILSLIVSQRLGDWYRLKLNVGDYRQRREETLFSKVDQAVERALSTGQEIIIPNLNSYERHLVHEYLDHREDIVTESRGEKPYRHLYVIPKN